jgi:hypothetical protein
MLKKPIKSDAEDQNTVNNNVLQAYRKTRNVVILVSSPETLSNYSCHTLLKFYLWKADASFSPLNL